MDVEAVGLMPAHSYLRNQFVWGASFSLMSVVYMIYQVETVGLDPLQLVLVGTALEISALVFEVPTGLLADSVSRKLSVVLGFAITGLSFVITGLFPVFEVLLASAFLWGIGWTFVSGAHEAWITDEVGVMEAGSLIVRGAKVNSYGMLVGIFAGVLIAVSTTLWLPLVIAGTTLIVWSFIAWASMLETRTVQVNLAEDRQIWRPFFHGINSIRTSPTLMLLMITAVIFGGFSEGYDRLSTAHLLRNFDFPVFPEPVVFFGVMAAVGNVLSMLALAQVEQRVETANTEQVARLLSVLFASVLVSVLIFAFAGWLMLALILYVVIVPLRRVMDPLIITWLNQHISSEQRATVLSMHGQCDAIGQAVAGPGVGAIARYQGIPVGLGLSACLLLPAVLLFLKAGPVSLKEKGET